MKNVIKKFGSIAFIALLVFALSLTGCKSMQLDYVEPAAQGPSQVRQGQELDSRQITVMGVYKDGSSKPVSFGNSAITFNSHIAGTQTVMIRVSGQQASFQTEVMALNSLTIASPPTTVTLKQGETPTWAGLQMRGEWDQMGSDLIPLSSCEISGFSADQTGAQIISVSYEGQKESFTINVVPMTSMQIVQAPTKVYYIPGEALDLTGLRVNGVWEGLPAEQITINASDVTGYNPNNTGVQNLTISKNGRSVNQAVEVLTLTSIDLAKPPNKIDYTVGQNIDLTGIQVMGHYTGSTANARRNEIIPESRLFVQGYNSSSIVSQQRVDISVGNLRGAYFFVNIAAPVVDRTQSGLYGTWNYLNYTVVITASTYLETNANGDIVSDCNITWEPFVNQQTAGSGNNTDYPDGFILYRTDRTTGARVGSGLFTFLHTDGNSIVMTTNANGMSSSTATKWVKQ